MENIKELEKKQKEVKEDANAALGVTIFMAIFAGMAVVAAQYIIAIVVCVGTILTFAFWYIPKRTESRKLSEQIKKKKKKKKT